MLREWPAFEALAKSFAEGGVYLRVAGLTGSAPALAVGELLLEALERCGYEKVETVVTVGQWSLRGGIVDVFSPSQAGPARLEFLGDDIESIRLFDPTSQRSVGTLDELLVLPLTPEDSAPEPAARLLDYLPAAAPVLVDLPKLLDEPTDETVADPPLRERLAGRQIVEPSLVAGTSSP